MRVKCLRLSDKRTERCQTEFSEFTKDQTAFLEKAIADLCRAGGFTVCGWPSLPRCSRTRLGRRSLCVESAVSRVLASHFWKRRSVPRANPKHRLHQKAAQALLQALLPGAGIDIKGQMRPEVELQQISGYTAGSRDFADLIHLLDGELRLITPSEPEGKDDGGRMRDEKGAAQGRRGRLILRPSSFIPPVLPTDPRLPRPLAAGMAHPQAAGDAPWKGRSSAYRARGLLGLEPKSAPFALVVGVPDRARIHPAQALVASPASSDGGIRAGIIPSAGLLWPPC